ncbi:MAG: hypothetical protein Q7S09_04425 [bacterium]|nr:hypothetical protein [bacterium]
MTFTHGVYFLLLPLFILLWVWAGRSRQWLLQPSKLQVKRSGIFSRAVLRLPLLLWLAVSTLLIFALARPVSTLKTTYLTLEKKVCMISYDVSTSMGRESGSTMEKIRIMALDFVQLRKGDFVGVSAYSGASSNTRGRGYAAIFTYPTEDLAQSEAAIRTLEATMLGPYTAIGDGIFISLIALIEEDARGRLGERYDRWLLEASVDSLGTPEEDLTYAREVADRVGPQKGKFVLLFTDGKYNTGIHPLKAIWFAKQLGIKVHFAAFDSSAATGLSDEEGQKRKAEIAEAVVATGGLYRESADVEGIAAIFQEISQAEKAKVVMEGELKEENQQKQLFQLAAVLFIAWVFIENFWMKIP